MNSGHLSKALGSPGWAIRKAGLVYQSWRSICPDDLMLATFPKSGSTWVRFFLYNLLGALEGRDSSNTLDDMNAVMSEYAHESMQNRWPFRSVNRIIKNHRKPDLITRKLRAILLIRDPRDIVISYLHFANASRDRKQYSGLSEVLNDKTFGVEAFLQHYEAWLPQTIHVVRYEDLMAEPLHHFSLLCDALGISAPDHILRASVEGSDKESTRSAQKRSPNMDAKFRGGFEFARDKPTNEWSLLATEEDHYFWQQISAKYGFNQYS